jgi:hypothetical protein
MECALWSKAEESCGEDTVWVRLLACLLAAAAYTLERRTARAGDGRGRRGAAAKRIRGDATTRLRTFSFPTPIGTKTVEL